MRRMPEEREKFFGVTFGLSPAEMRSLLSPFMENLPNPNLIQEEVNPYAPPVAEVVNLETVGVLPDAYETASRLKRFINWVIDRLAIVGVIMAVSFFFALLEGMGFISGFTDYLDDVGALEDIFFTAVFTVFYYTATETLFSRSLGKLITGTKVITMAGGKPSFLSVLGRSFARLVPFEPFSMFGDSAWHDGWSGTQVIDLRKKIVGPRSQIMRGYYR